MKFNHHTCPICYPHQPPTMSVHARTVPSVAQAQSLEVIFDYLFCSYPTPSCLSSPSDTEYTHNAGTASIPRAPWQSHHPLCPLDHGGCLIDDLYLLRLQWFSSQHLEGSHRMAVKNLRISRQAQTVPGRRPKRGCGDPNIKFTWACGIGPAKITPGLRTSCSQGKVLAREMH